MPQTLGVWKILFETGKHPLSSEVITFLKKVGEMDPLEILINKERYSYIPQMLRTSIQSSMNSEFKALVSELLLMSDDANAAIPLRALIVFYAAKSLGNSLALTGKSTKTQTAVENQYLLLGYATEFLYWSQLFHYATSEDPANESKETKVMVLVGDFLITQFYTSLADLESNEVVKLMNEALVAFSENAFCQRHSKEKHITEEAISIMFANAFKSAAILSGQDDEQQRAVEAFGKSFGRAYSIYSNANRRGQCISGDKNNTLKSRFAIQWPPLMKEMNKFLEDTSSDIFQTILNIMETEVGKRIEEYND